MTVGIDDGTFFLIDLWPGEVTDGPNPSSWTTYSATEDFPLGTKRRVYDDTNNGWATLMYLKFNKGTYAYATVKSICTIDTAEAATATQYCHVCNDASEGELLGPVAICLGTTSATALYGWFWVGGVCPVDTISGLDGIHGSEGNVTAGNWLVLVESASLNKFHVGTATDVANYCAFAMADDTTS